MLLHFANIDFLIRIQILNSKLRISNEIVSRHLNQKIPETFMASNIHSCSLLWLFCLFLLTSAVENKSMIEQFDQIVNSIFEEHSIFLTYVSSLQHSQNLTIFSYYCKQSSISCAIIDPSTGWTQKIKRFIGFHENSEFFFILDPTTQKKYILTLSDSSMEENDLNQFVMKFNSGDLEPFYSSQEAPVQDAQFCQKLVGKNLDRFLEKQASLKVVFMYIAEEQSCPICQEMLIDFRQLSQRLYRQDTIAFGYFDILKNDHPKIPDEIAPYILVFEKGSREPYGIEGEKFDQLEQGLINIIAETIYPSYFENAHPQHIPQEIQIQGYDSYGSEDEHQHRGMQL